MPEILRKNLKLILKICLEQKEQDSTNSWKTSKVITDEDAITHKSNFSTIKFNIYPPRASKARKGRLEK